MFGLLFAQNAIALDLLVGRPAFAASLRSQSFNIYRLEMLVSDIGPQVRSSLALVSSGLKSHRMHPTFHFHCSLLYFHPAEMETPPVSKTHLCGGWLHTMVSLSLFLLPSPFPSELSLASIGAGPLRDPYHSPSCFPHPDVGVGFPRSIINTIQDIHFHMARSEHTTICGLISADPALAGCDPIRTRR